MRLNSAGGFTLIEAIATTILVGLVFTAGIAATLPIMRFARLQQIDVTVSDELGSGIEWIKKDALSADSRTIGAGTLQLNITDYAGGGGGGQITYAIFNPSGTLRELRRTSTIDGTIKVVVRDRVSSPADKSLAANYVAGSLNSFTIELTKNDADGQPILKRSAVMLRCRATD